jgi:hypothetical protein
MHNRQYSDNVRWFAALRFQEFLLLLTPLFVFQPFKLKVENLFLCFLVGGNTDEVM